MDSAKLNDWMQVVGIFAVVASLIFVGLQMKQAQEIAIASHYQERYASSVDFWVAREQSDIQKRLRGERVIRDWGVPPGMDENVSAMEVGSEFLYARIVLASGENSHFQYLSGFYTEDAWRGSRLSLKSALKQPMLPFIIKNMEGAYRPDFLELCEELIAENQAESR
jgi:hypothetical protein